jgi:carbonic anhydrase
MSLLLSRRNFLTGCVCCAGAVAAAHTGMPAAWAADSKKTDLTADQALEVLKKGNAEFKTDAPYRAANDRDRRQAIARGQTPFAVLVACSDSRVSPELLFGRGLGELFIVRNAGNTVDTAALGSIEYAVGVLGVPLVVVLGHERCGAVDAAIDVVTKNAVYPGSIGRMIEPIIPAVLQAQTGRPNDLLHASIRSNVSRSVSRLRAAAEPLLLDPLRGKTLRIVGAAYDLDDGSVDFFDEA